MALGPLEITGNIAQLTRKIDIDIKISMKNTTRYKGANRLTGCLSKPSELAPSGVTVQ